MSGRENAKLKIALLGSRGYPSTYSGYETLVRYLAPYLRDQGHEVIVYGRHRGRGWRRTEIDGITVVESPTLETKALSTPSNVITSARHIAGEGVDCVMAVNLACAPALVWLERRGIPTALNVDGLEWRRGKWGPVAKSIFFACAALASSKISYLVADSRGISDYYSMTFGASTVFIPYGGVTKVLSETDRLEEMGLTPGGYMLVVARLIPENSIALILDAYERSSADLPFVVVGDANYRSDLALRLGRLDEEGTIRWLGHVSDQELLEQLWAHPKLYLHGHSVGGTNPSLLQALGLGAPVLALDTPFNREVVMPFEDSLFAGDAESLSIQIDDALAGRLDLVSGDDARALINDRYSWSAVLADYEALMQQVAASV